MGTLEEEGGQVRNETGGVPYSSNDLVLHIVFALSCIPRLDDLEGHVPRGLQVVCHRDCRKPAMAKFVLDTISPIEDFPDSDRIVAASCVSFQGLSNSFNIGLVVGLDKITIVGRFSVLKRCIRHHLYRTRRTKCLSPSNLFRCTNFRQQIPFRLLRRRWVEFPKAADSEADKMSGKAVGERKEGKVKNS